MAMAVAENGRLSQPMCVAAYEDLIRKDGAFRRFVKKIRGKKEKRNCFHCSTPTTQGPLYGVIICPACQKKAGPWARSAKPCCQRMKGCEDLAVYVDDIGFAEAELDAYTRILEVLRGRSCWYCQIVATPLARAVRDWKGQQEPGKTSGAKRAAAPVATNIIGMLMRMKGCEDLAVYVDDVGFGEAEIEAYTHILEVLRGHACWYCKIVGTPLARALNDWRSQQAPGKTRGAKRAAAPVATNIIGMLMVFLLLGMSTATSSHGQDRLNRVASKQRDVWIWQSTPTTWFGEAEIDAYTHILEVLRDRACWYCELVGTPLARALSD
ncbi:unnamed protein product, partial [Mesorhabditis spiculigera]